MKKEKKLSSEELQAEATTLYVAGLSVREIASRLGTSKSTIARIVKIDTRKDLECSSQCYAVSASAAQQIGEVSPRGVNTQSPSTLNSQLSTLKAPQLLSDISTTVAQIIRQIGVCTDGETDVAKLATAADKLAGVAERLNNIAQLQQAADNSQGQFTNDFANRHRQHKS